ncbi:hypothetical protein Tco_0805350 [Tanacetum coccineum]
MELVLELTQQGSSYEVSISAEGVEELKIKVKIKGEKKEALLTLRQKPGRYICYQNHKDELLTLKTCDIMDPVDPHGFEDLHKDGHGGRKAYLLEDKQILSVGVFDEFLALGWLLDEVRVTWAHLKKKRTRLRLYTKSLKRFLALGWILEEIHVTWAHLENKWTRLRLYTRSLEEIIIQTVETASPTLATASELDQDGARSITTALECSHLK